MKTFCFNLKQKKKEALLLSCIYKRLLLIEAPFKRRANTVPNSIDRIKFDLSTVVARRLKPSRATAV